MDGGHLCLYLQAKWSGGSSSGSSPSDTRAGRAQLANAAAHYSLHPEREQKEYSEAKPVM